MFSLYKQLTLYNETYSLYNESFLLYSDYICYITNFHSFSYLYLQEGKYLNAREHLQSFDNIRTHLAPHMFCTAIIQKDEKEGRFHVDCDITHQLHGCSLCGPMVSSKRKMEEGKLFTLGHETRTDINLYYNKYLCPEHASRYHKQMMKFLEDGNHEVTTTDAGMTLTPKESLSVVGEEK